MPKPRHPLFSELSRYIYGTTRLGHADVPLTQRQAMADEAVRAGVWLHTSRQYDNALEVLGEALARLDGPRPRFICKIGNDSLQQLRASIRANLEPLGLKSLDVGQLCLGGEFADSVAEGGDALDQLQALKEEGLVRRFVYEVFPWNSASPYRLLQSGRADGLIDAFIFYLNPLQRFAANPLWDLIVEREFPVIAMRTVCGAPVHDLRDKPGAAWVPYLKNRAIEVAPIFERSGTADWTEFCVRFAFSFRNVKATVGSTARSAYFARFMEFARAEFVEPLPEDIVREIAELQRRWSDEIDTKAEPWTM